MTVRTGEDREERHRLTAFEGLAALSLDALSVPLITLRTPRRSLAPPIVKYLRQVEDDERFHRLVVLIPEVQPEHWWRWILYNQRGLVLQRAIQRGTANVVICRLRYQLGAVAAAQPEDTAAF